MALAAVKPTVDRLLCLLLGTAGDHGWAPVWMDTQEKLIDGRISAGYLMVRRVSGQKQFRHMNAEEELEALRSGESL